MVSTCIARFVGALCGLAACVALTAAEPPPRVELPAKPPQRNFTVKSQTLHVRPGTSSTYFEFGGGVLVSGADFSLSADIVELDIESREVTSGEAFKLPKLGRAEERAVEDPGKAAAEMARELKLPDARFSTRALKRLGASGNVSVSAKGITLSTSGLVSTDGGRSWATTGRCRVNRRDPVSGDVYSMEADTVVYDTQTQRALARGAIVGKFSLGRNPPVEVHAEHCELDLAKTTLTVSGGLKASFGELQLRCDKLGADLKQQTIHASGAPHLEHGSYQVRMDADGLTVNLQTQRVHAQGGVKLYDDARGISVLAGELEADLPGKTLVATGSPSAQYQGSTFSGTKITVRQEAGKTVIEAEGPQQARIDISEKPKQPR